jgi:hypothetical protein
MTDVLVARSDHASPTIGAAWIRANLLGALANAAAQFAAYALSAHALSAATAIGTPHAASRLMAYVVAVTAIIALGYVFGAFLTARVLQQKLPAFRTWYWLTLFAVFGLVMGAVTAFSLPMSGAPSGEPTAGEFAIVAALVAVAAYAVMGAAVGAVQAIVLFHAARGLRAWIGYSALAGLTWMILYLTVFYGPKTGLAQEIASVTSVFAIAVISSVIMLPALHRLRPR